MIKSLEKLPEMLQDSFPYLAVLGYSLGRNLFLEEMRKAMPEETFRPPEEFRQVLGGVEFGGWVSNGAGMFKTPENYEQEYRKGAAAYLIGSASWNPNKAIKIFGISGPFALLQLSRASGNRLRLPNPGRVAVEMLADTDKKPGCPIGLSIVEGPDDSEKDKLPNLAKLVRLGDRMKVDFFQYNANCPNAEDHSDLKKALDYINDARSSRPLEVKISGDTELHEIPGIMDTLFEKGVNGLVAINSMKNYGALRGSVSPSERIFYDYITGTFGMAIGGLPIARKSRQVVERASKYLAAGPPSQDFYIVAIGGIRTAQDLIDMKRLGASRMEWINGYFENYKKHGNDLYKKKYEEVKNAV